jgi:Mg-chelatase subunit ChlD
MMRCKEGDPQWVVTLVTSDGRCKVETRQTLEDAVDVALQFEAEGEGDVLIAAVRWRSLPNVGVPS